MRRVFIVVMAALVILGCPDTEQVRVFTEALEVTAFPSVTDLNGNPTQGEFKSAIGNLHAATTELPGAKAATKLTISGGSITPTQGFHTIDTEAASAGDDLETITVTNMPDGRILILQQEDDSRDITLVHGAGGTGQIILPGAVDITLADSFDGVILRREGNQWTFLSRLSSLPASYAPHGKALFDSPGVTNWTVPAGVTEVWLSAVGGGGAGGDATDGASDGGDGGNGDASSVWLSGVGDLIIVSGGAGGGGAKSATAAKATEMAQIPCTPISAFAAGSYPRVPQIGNNGGGMGGDGGYAATAAYAGAAGQAGMAKFWIPASVSFGQTLQVTVGAGGLPAGTGPAQLGVEGAPGAVLIEY